jgi:hypothetical protein
MTINQVKAFIADTTDWEPIFDILQTCTKKLGWQIVLEVLPPNKIVRGMCIGTEEYLDETIGK